VGKYTIPMAKIVGENGLVIAIEAHPKNYKCLVENVRLNNLKNVVALNMATWSEERKLKLFIGDSSGHHSLKMDFRRGFILIQARALDDVLRELGVSKVDCIKIDVEGAELETLKGLRKTLREYRPIIIAEVRKENVDKVKEFLQEQGYVMEEVAPMHYVLKPRS